MKTFDVTMPKPQGDGRHVWIKLGVAFLDEKSKSGQLTIRLDAVPLKDGQPFFPNELRVFLNHPRRADGGAAEDES